MIPALLHQLTHDWRPLLEAGGVAVEPPLYALKVGSISPDEHPRTFLIFDRTGEQPLLSAKVARSRADRDQLGHEYATLQSLAAIEPLRSSLPIPLLLREINPTTVALVERGLPGTPLTTLLRTQQHLSPEQVRADLALMQRWLTCFQEATTSACPPLEGRERVEHLLARLEPSIREALPDDFVKGLRQQGDTFASLPVPLVGRHGDFWAGNLLIGDDSLAVIDWDGYRGGALPFHDLFHFIVTYAQTYPWHRWRWTNKLEGFARGFLSEGWFSALLHQHVQGYLGRLAIPMEAAHLLFSLYLMGMAAPDHGARDSFRGRWSGLLPFYARRQHDSIFYGIGRNAR